MPSLYRLSPPHVSGSSSRIRIFSTVVIASVAASTGLWLATAMVSGPGEAAPVPLTAAPPLHLADAGQAFIGMQTTAPTPEAAPTPAPLEQPSFEMESGVKVLANRTIVHPIQSGESFGGLLSRYGITQPNAIINAAASHYNLAKLKAGKTLKLEFVREMLTELSYEIDSERTLQIDLSKEEPVVSVHEMQWSPTLVRKELVLTSSLWSAAVQAGFKPADIVRLSQIFEYDIDFASELQHNARFTVVMDELHREDGGATKPGDFHAVRLVNAGKEYTSVRYESKSGREGWYHPDGTATARPFLRSPLEFTRITSRFGVNRKTHYHGGVDMGAPTGTPIRAAGDGVVQLAGRRGAYGKHIKLSHKRYGPYHTSYSHLSKIHVRAGQHVKQGQVIGRVGSTGRSTGPHLHYEFHIRGKRVNPMKTKLPGSKSLPRKEKAAFKRVAAKWLPQLDGLSTTEALSDADDG